MILRLKQMETPRLFLREMLPADAKDFFQLNLDPEVIRYTGDVPFESFEKSEQFLEKYPGYTYEHCGYGRWTCILKETGENVGWCGIRLHEDGQVDLGYRFHKRFWNKGLATEASFASLKLAFEFFKLEEVYACAHEENLASIRIMQKTGMTFQKKVDTEHYYIIRKQAFNCPFKVQVYLQ